MGLTPQLPRTRVVIKLHDEMQNVLRVASSHNTESVGIEITALVAAVTVLNVAQNYHWQIAKPQPHKQFSLFVCIIMIQQCLPP